jgi:short-subunit dehydrogenase
MLTGVFNGISTFGGRMRELGRGHIVNMSSMVGLIGLARQGAYAAAKFGVVGLSEVLRSEMQPHGVGVSVVCPARVKTNLLARNRPAHLGDNEGLAADVVANRVIDAVQNDVFYVITNPEQKALIASRSAQLIDAFDVTPTL